MLLILREPQDGEVVGQISFSSFRHFMFSYFRVKKNDMCSYENNHKHKQSAAKSEGMQSILRKQPEILELFESVLRTIAALVLGFFAIVIVDLYSRAFLSEEFLITPSGILIQVVMFSSVAGLLVGCIVKNRAWIIGSLFSAFMVFYAICGCLSFGNYLWMLLIVPVSAVIPPAVANYMSNQIYPKEDDLNYANNHIH